MERGGRGCEGVEVPGVAGGVKAGEMKDGGGLRAGAGAGCEGDEEEESVGGVKPNSGPGLRGCGVHSGGD